MSSVFSGTNQGSFISTGKSVLLPVRAGIDWMMVWNYTQAATQETPGRGVFFYWQLGMVDNTGIEIQKSDGTDVLNMVTLASGGFRFVDTTVNIPGPAIVLSAISAGQPPVVSTGNTAGIVDGDVVRLFNVAGAQQLGGIDFTIGNIVTSTSFELIYMEAIAAATTGHWRRIPYDPYFYPPTRVISKISADASGNAIITMTVTHNYTIGQVVRLIIPTVTAAAFGMTELNGVQATIINIDQADADGETNTITVDVNITGFTAFAWPLTGDGAFTPAQVVPVGENSAEAQLQGTDILGDSEFNRGVIGMLLAAGAQSPAGEDGDLIYWVAGKSFSGGM